jgi:hypothetical protein
MRRSVAFGLISLLAWLGAAGAALYRYHQLAALRSGPPPQTARVISAPPATPSAPPSATPAAGQNTPAPLPPSVLISMPYTSQAPTGNFDSAHEEYCEAAAVLMVGRYFAGDRRAQIPGGEADASMRGIVAWERAAFPGVLDLPLVDVQRVAAHFYGLAGEVVPVDLGAIKRSLAAGQPVIIPVMTHGAPGGQKIAPYYGAVSVYHVIVLVGYDAAKGIVYTNDAGFSVYPGRAYPYAWSTLSAAIDAQTQSAKTKVRQGRVMLILHRS